MTTLFAYIDPFTGSLVLQLLLMAFASVAIFFKKVKAFILGLFGVKTTAASIEDTEDTPSIPLHANTPSNHEQETKAA